MTTSENKPAQLIHLAMIAILSDIEAIAKSEENKAQGFKFRGIEQVMNELHPIFRAHGVYILPQVESSEHREAGLTKSGAVITRAIVTVGYRFVASDGSTVPAKMIGEGLDSGDKATPKAVSMALKGLLTQAFLIPTADIVDADYYSPTVDAREQLALQQRDRVAIQRIIDKHLADAKEIMAQAESEPEKSKKQYLIGRAKELQGLAAELRTTMADFDVTPNSEVQPAGPIEPETKTDANPDVIPPKEKATRTRKATAPATSWQEVTDHVSSPFGNLLGNKLGSLFKPDASKKGIDGLYNHYLDKVGKLANPTTQDTALWHAVKDAYAAWEAAQKGENAPGTPEPAAGSTTPPTTPKPVTAPAASQDWREFVIESKAQNFNGRKLGDMNAAEMEAIGGYLEKIDPQRATLYQKKLGAMFALYEADLRKHLRDDGKPEHTVQLLAALDESNLDYASFLAEAKKSGWIEESRTCIGDITEDEAAAMLREWAMVEQACDQVPA